MDEEDFLSWRNFKPWGTEDALRADVEMRRSSALAVALWSRTPADLQRQLLAPHPAIPAGFDLAEFHNLYRKLRVLTIASKDLRRGWLAAMTKSSPVITVGNQSFTIWEARCEVVRRAIEYLERR